MLKIHPTDTQESHTHVWTPCRLRLLTNSFDARKCICGAIDYLAAEEGKPPRWVQAISSRCARRSPALPPAPIRPPATTAPEAAPFAEPFRMKIQPNKIPTPITEAVAELTLTLHALRAGNIEQPRDCRLRIAAAFIRAACAQLDSRGVLASCAAPRRGEPHGAERDWS